MEKLMFRKIQLELWSVLALLLLFLFITFQFGYTAFRRAPADSTYGGSFGNFVEGVISLPTLTAKVLSGQTDDHIAPYQTYALDGGFTQYLPAANPQFVFISRYDPEMVGSRIELVDERDFSVQHSQFIKNRAALSFDVVQPKLHNAVTAAAYTQRVVNPMPLDSGEVVFSLHYAPLYRMDACGDVRWINNEFAFHHAITEDADGNFWVPGASLNPNDTKAFDPAFTTRPGFRDDHIVKVSPDGDVLFSKSVLAMLADHGLDNRVYTYDRYMYDPIHLNDVEPVLSDGPHWKRGDLFLSLAHINMILLYRPSTDEIVWWSQDKMMHQHDVDILDDDRIAYFDNQRRTHGAGDYVIGPSLVRVYNFATDEHSVLFEDQFETLDIKTINQGLQDFGANGSLMVEETNTGRLVKLSPDGDVEWQYANKSEQDVAYTLNWSRYISREQAYAFLAGVARQDCAAET